jgi:superfamily I DNA/RNA helicase
VSQSDKQIYQNEFTRIRNAFGGDRGLFVVGLHSFMEMHMNRVMHDFEGEGGYNSKIKKPNDIPFWRKLELYGEYLLNVRGNSPHLRSFNDISAEHSVTNGVRHRFADISEDETRGAISNFRSFCAASGLASPVIDEISQSLQLWTDRVNIIDADKELSELQQNIVILHQQLEMSQADRSQVEQAAKDASRLEVELSKKDAEIQRLTRTAGQRKEKIDELRAQRHQLAQEAKAAESLLEQVAELRRANEALLRLSVLTRTRRDFEQHILRLSQDQSQAVKAIKSDEDFMVRGGAGSGKTVVLLEALKRALEDAARQGELFEEDGAGQFALLTYTRTLVKYDRYISSILEIVPASESGEARLSIDTVDRFIRSLWKRYCAGPGKADWFGVEIIYGRKEKEDIHEAISDLAADSDIDLAAHGLTPSGLFTEIERFLWSYGISEDEYVNQMIARTGLSGNLDGEARQAVWELSEKLKELFAENAVVVRNHACALMLEYLESGGDPGVLLGNEDSAGDGRLRSAYIDEVQDLPPIVLKLIRKISRHVVMAGDGAQSIYGPTTPLMRAGIDIRGRSRVLRMNFRNTIPMLELAESFRQKAGIGPADESERPSAFRPGPPVGFFAGKDDGEAKGMLFSRIRFFLDDLGYEPENVCVMAPALNILKGLAEQIGSELESEAVLVHRPEWEFIEPDEKGRVVHRGVEEFDFASSKGVRLCTLHSAKGLDFPVVLLYLPIGVRLKWMDMLSEDQRNRTMAGVLYVALTRALDHLEVIAGPKFGSEGAEAALLEAVESVRVEG